jgi:hypothetical protein
MLLSGLIISLRSFLFLLSRAQVTLTMNSGCADCGQRVTQGGAV